MSTTTTYLSPTVSPTLNRQPTTPNARPLSLSTPIHLLKGTPLHRRFRSPLAHNYDHIPKQFRAENLPDDLMENYNNVPEFVYGLRPSEMNMFMSEGGPFRRQQETDGEEIISTARDYPIICGPSEEKRPPRKRRYKIATGTTSGTGKKKGGPPPDLPSYFLNARIIVLSLPIYSSVAQLIVSQIVFLNLQDQTKPIYMYINSTGTELIGEYLIGYHSDAYAIADAMRGSIAKIYTMNIGKAFGQAAMLLSLGEKGHRLIRPNAQTYLYLPSTYPTSNIASKLLIQRREMELEVENYLNLLAGSTGKSKEEIAEDLKRPRYFSPEEAIAYGIADKISERADVMYDKTKIDELRAKGKALDMANLANLQNFRGIG